MSAELTLQFTSAVGLFAQLAIPTFSGVAVHWELKLIKRDEAISVLADNLAACDRSDRIELGKLPAPISFYDSSYNFVNFLSKRKIIGLPNHLIDESGELKKKKFMAILRDQYRRTRTTYEVPAEIIFPYSFYLIGKENVDQLYFEFIIPAHRGAFEPIGHIDVAALPYRS